MSGAALAWQQFRIERKLFWRNPSAAFFSFILPLTLLLLVAFAVAPAATGDLRTLTGLPPHTWEWGVSLSSLGYAVAGLTIVYKQMNAVLQLLQFALMGIAFVPLTAVPLFELAPTAKGIDMIRQVMAAGTPLATFTALDWATLVGTGAFWFVLGLGVYLLFERRSMNRGLLGHY